MYVVSENLNLYRVKHTTRAQCIGTIRSLIEVQNQLQPPYFVHKLEMTIFLTLWKAQNQFWGVGVGFGKFHMEK